MKHLINANKPQFGISKLSYLSTYSDAKGYVPISPNSQKVIHNSQRSHKYAMISTIV